MYTKLLKREVGMAVDHATVRESGSSGRGSGEEEGEGEAGDRATQGGTGGMPMMVFVLRKS